VKRSLLLPAWFLFYFILLLMLFSLLHVVGDGGSSSLVQKIPNSLRESVPGAVVAAILVLFFHMIQNPGNHLISLIILLATATAVLVTGSYGADLLYEPEISNVSPTVVQGSFRNVEEGLLFTENEEEGALRGLVLYRSTPLEEEWRLTYYPAGILGNGRVVFPNEESVQLSAAPVPAIQAGLLTQYLDDIRLFSGDLYGLIGESIWRLWLLGFSIVFATVASYLFMRVTRWRLFNVFFTFIVVRGIFFAYSAIRSAVVPQLGDQTEPSLFLDQLPVLVLLALGALFLLADIVFIWRKETRIE
jgi:hypothetical protein